MTGRMLLIATLLTLSGTSRAQAQQVDWGAVDRAMGRSGAAQADGTYKYSMPRSDLKVTVQGVEVLPALALGSWVAMKPGARGGVVAAGDLVLAPSEIEAVLSKLQDGGVMQTAIHNHLLFETPRIMYTHIHAEGDPVAIATTIRSALALTATPGPSATGGGARGAFPLDTAAIARVLGRHGSVSGGVYKVSVARRETVHANGEEIPASMGTATALGFQPTATGEAAVTGDFVLSAAEVNAVIKALREHGIMVTALHNHMLFDEPRLFFMHFWAVGPAVETARGLRAALDQMAVR